MGILDTSYYGWNEVPILQTLANFEEIQDLRIYSIKVFSTKVAYCTGYMQQNSIYYLVTLRSSDGGLTWNIVDKVKDGVGRDVAVDPDGVVYVCGGLNNSDPVGSETEGASTANSKFAVRKSITGLTGSFATIETFSGTANGSQNEATGIAIDSTGSVYVCGWINDSGTGINWAVRKSIDGSSGSFTTIDTYNISSDKHYAMGIAIDSNDNVYVCGSEANTDWLVRRSTTGLSGSFSTVDYHDNSGNQDVARRIAIDSNDNVYVCGFEFTSVGSRDFLIRKSTTGASGSFSTIDSLNAIGGNEEALDIAIDSKDQVYACGYEDTNDENWIVRKSSDGSSGSFIYANVGSSISQQYSWERAWSVDIDDKDFIYIIGELGASPAKYKTILRKGRLTTNSASLGERMLATSFGYVFSEDISGSLDERFKLNNIAEFPHSSGLFQMKNMILGTQSKGTIGKNIEENIITVNHVGSFVQIVWPKQDTANSNVKGFGDLSVGQKPGKLTTTWSPGEFFDVTEFDHLTLWNYVLKNSSGSLDDVQIKIERRPLRSTGFTTEQGIEDSISGSYTVSKYRDHIHEKEIDYGDLSIKEISWPIDMNLENTKELRISVKHKFGQSSEDNKNFISWGRFIKSEEET